jgi:pimeloyl-ACP methyl ester carboxylesterase
MVKRRSLIASAVAAGASLAVPKLVFAQTDATPVAEGAAMTDTTPQTGYAPGNGLDMYYEIHGSGGVPLVLLHGGISTIDVDFGRILPGLARTRQVIALEQQAHGHTADIDLPLSTARMADDTAAALRHLGVEQADIFGYSVGAGIALELSIRYPELVRKLVLATIIINESGYYPGHLEGMASIEPEMLAGSPFAEAYTEVAPNPDDFPVLLEKIIQFSQSGESWSDEDVQKIKAPALLMAGDSDIVHPEHMVQIFRLLGGGVPGDVVGLPASRLAILPGTTHITLVHRADWLQSMVTEFLDAPMPETG